MKNFVFIFITTIIIFAGCKIQQRNDISKIEFNLSAFGVESDSFPSIQGYIDFTNDSNNFIKSYYNPSIKGTNYKLSSDEIKSILNILQNCNLSKLKNEYSVSVSDEPTSTIKIYTNSQTYSIKDYGLMGATPLPELYKIVYKY